MKPRFSVILPVNVWNEYRQKALQRAIDSVMNQTYPDFELVIVDDGSTQPFDWLTDKRVKVVHKQHEERVIALSAGFAVAKGQIFTLLDSDDEYDPRYLEEVDGWFKKYPKYKMFNFGCRYMHTDGVVTTRGPFKPKKNKVGHEVFGGGNIVNGTFVWDRYVYEHLGGYPPKVIKDIDCSEINYGGVRDLFMGTPYDFSAAAQLEFPELRQYFMVDFMSERDKLIKELGNPWGQDMYLFYKFTRKYHSKPIDGAYLYVVHPKSGIE